MINWDIVIFLTGIMLFCYWLNFAMGNPLSSNQTAIDTSAILFFVPKFFAIRRLKSENLLRNLKDHFDQEIAIACNDPVLETHLSHDYDRNIFLTGRQFFTWEKMFLCPVCFHWWVTLAVSTAFVFSDWHGAVDYRLGIIFTYLVNHLLIRKIS